MAQLVKTREFVKSVNWCFVGKCSKMIFILLWNTVFGEILWWYQIQSNVVSGLNLDCSHHCWCWQTDVAVLFGACEMMPGPQEHATWQEHGTKSPWGPDQDCRGWDTAGAGLDRHCEDVGRQTPHTPVDLQHSCCGQLQWTETPSCSRYFARLERVSKQF